MMSTPGSFVPRKHDRGPWLGMVVFAWGVQAIVTQSLLLRESLVLMFGSELAWGVVLFAWLFGVAVGGVLGGWVAPRLRRPDVGLAAVLLALSVGACAELWLFRGARAWLGVEPGELLPLPETAAAAMLFISPVGGLVGLAFPLACCVRSHDERIEMDRAGPPHETGRTTRFRRPDRRDHQEQPRGAGPLGHVYALESAGSLVGGAAFSFWAVEHLTPIQTVLVCGTLTLAASAGLLVVRASCRPYGAACLATLAVAAMVVSIFAGEGLNRRLVQRRWHTIAPGYELVAETESKYQNLAVTRREEQFTLYCDGQVSADFPDPYTFVPPAHFWMCQHPSPRRVLTTSTPSPMAWARV